MILQKCDGKYRALIAGALWSLCVFMPTNGLAQSDMAEKIDTREQNDFFVYKGDLISLKVYSLTRIAVTNPGVVDIAKADVDEILLIGKTVGETSIFIWDEYGKRVVTARVFAENMDAIIMRMQKLFTDAGITEVTLEKNLYEGKIEVKGTIPELKKTLYTQIVAKFSGSLIEFAKIEPLKDMVLIDGQISEINTTLSQALGIDWSTGTEGITLPYTEALPTFDGSIGDFFKIGDFRRTAAITATVNAIITEGKGRVLSKPSIMVSNGNSASFLVGGEIPIRTTTTSAAGASVQENITFTSYGVDLTVTPTIRDDDKIEITLNVSVRDVDAANAVGGNVAFTTRSAQTKLFVDNGQTVILAGLIKHNKGDTVTRIPFLSDIPVAGALFRSRSHSPDQDQEVVISLTPRIQKSQKPGIKTGETQTAETKMGETKTASPIKEEAAETPKQEAVEQKSAGEQAAANGESVPSPAPATTESPETVPSTQETGQDEPSQEKLSGTEENAETKSAEGADHLESSPAQEPGSESSMSSDDVSPEGAEETGQEGNRAVTNYVQAVQKKIAQRVSFPYEAKEKGWEGTVKLTLTILSDGTLNDVAVKESSGHDIFDNDAVNTAKILAPFDPFPAEIDLEEISVTIPIVYSQKTALEETNIDQEKSGDSTVPTLSNEYGDEF